MTPGAATMTRGAMTMTRGAVDDDPRRHDVDARRDPWYPERRLMSRPDRGIVLCKPARE